jgi:hypothetical protein
VQPRNRHFRRATIREDFKPERYVKAVSKNDMTILEIVAFIMQIAVNERCALPENIEAGLRCADAATIFVALLNRTLPKRLQLSDADFTTRLMYFQNEFAP